MDNSMASPSIQSFLMTTNILPKKKPYVLYQYISHQPLLQELGHSSIKPEDTAPLLEKLAGSLLKATIFTCRIPNLPLRLFIIFLTARDKNDSVCIIETHTFAAGPDFGITNRTSQANSP